MLLDDKLWVKGCRVKGGRITVYYEVSGCCQHGTKSSTIVVKVEEIESEKCSILLINDNMRCLNKNVMVTEVNLIGNVYRLRTVRRQTDLVSSDDSAAVDRLIMSCIDNEYVILAPSIYYLSNGGDLDLKNAFSDFIEYGVIRECILWAESKANYGDIKLNQSDKDVIVAQNGYEFLLVNPMTTTVTNNKDKSLSTCPHYSYSIQSAFFYSKRSSSDSVEEDDTTLTTTMRTLPVYNVNVTYRLSKLQKINSTVCILCMFKNYLSFRGFNYFIKCAPPLSYVLVNY